MNLRDFLTARLDEREQLALAVRERQRSWHVDGGLVHGHPMDEVIDWCYVDNALEFMAANDPKQAIADMAALRAVLGVHGVVPEARYPGVARPWPCDGCNYNGFDGYATYDIEQCPTLRALALAYVDHPDYDPAWRTA